MKVWRNISMQTNNVLFALLLFLLHSCELLSSTKKNSKYVVYSMLLLYDLRLFCRCNALKKRTVKIYTNVWIAIESNSTMFSVQCSRHVNKNELDARAEKVAIKRNRLSRAILNMYIIIIIVLELNQMHIARSCGLIYYYYWMLRTIGKLLSDGSSHRSF